ncbi:MAG TPA: hypothetical protein VFY36_03005 [Solirubrobacteraceae bacterium]|nr:hypothetical protein [Solirubrobacteraceae bacterium]
MPIRIELGDPDAMAMWRTVAKVAAAFGEDRRWCLVGGLMVALFAIEAQQIQRATTDIDVLADARARPSGTVWATGCLRALGATVHEIQRSKPARGFRFDLDGQIVDVLAPDGLGSAGATTSGKLQTIQIPGGTQALARTEIVEIVVEDNAVALRRPTLIAAILLKARSLRVHSRPEDQRHDLVTLLSLLDDPRAARTELTSKEIGWMRSIDGRLSIDDPSLQESFEAARLRSARAAHRVLVS